MTPGHLANERVARGPALVERLARCRIGVCGAGALGANLVEHLARMGAADLRVIDRDRIEERNLATQPWQRADIGKQKATVLATAVFRAVNVDVDAQAKELTADNARALLAERDVVIDCFDNTTARQLTRDACAALGTPLLHVGLAPGFAEVIWDERYTVPVATGDDACDVGLARSLVMLAVSVAAESVVAFIDDGRRQNSTITLGDLKISPI